jgi:hypothetical protein
VLLSVDNPVNHERPQTLRANRLIPLWSPGLALAFGCLWIECRKHPGQLRVGSVVRKHCPQQKACFWCLVSCPICSPAKNRQRARGLAVPSRLAHIYSHRREPLGSALVALNAGGADAMRDTANRPKPAKP